MQNKNLQKIQKIPPTKEKFKKNTKNSTYKRKIFLIINIFQIIYNTFHNPKYDKSIKYINFESISTKSPIFEQLSTTIYNIIEFNVIV